MEEKVSQDSRDMTEDVRADFMRETLGEVNSDANLYSPLSLAYLGDSVYELMIRTRLLKEGDTQVAKLNERGFKLAMAKTQARLVELLEGELSDEEHKLIQRGKNAKVGTIPKSCTPQEYHLATGFECLIGYLYLDGQHERIKAIVEKGWELLDKA